MRVRLFRFVNERLCKEGKGRVGIQARISTSIAGNVCKGGEKEKEKFDC